MRFRFLLALSLLLLYVLLLQAPYVYACFSCKPGSYADPLNKYCNETICGGPGLCLYLNNCTECEAGYYQENFNASSCDPCPKGHFSNKNRSDTCYACPNGQYAPTNGTKECSICGPGNGTKTTGATECIVCGAGTYSPGNSQCRYCLPGTYNPYRGQSVCSECGEGYFQREMGATDKSQCSLCQPGFFCPASMNGYPSKCQPNYYCPGTGLTTQYACPTLRVSDQGAQYCVMGPIFYVLLVGGIFLILFAGWMIYHCRSSRKYDELIVDITPRRGEVYDEHEVLAPNPQVVYSGL
jgi:hypothetical protein